MIDMTSPDIYSVTTTVSIPRARPSFLISAAWWPMPSARIVPNCILIFVKASPSMQRDEISAAIFRFCNFCNIKALLAFVVQM